MQFWKKQIYFVNNIGSNKIKILVCGATGFIGHNIAESFAKRGDFQVIGVHNKRPKYNHPNLEWVQADLNNSQDIKNA